MTKIELNQSVIRRARDRAALTTEEQATIDALLGKPGDNRPKDVVLADAPAAFLRALLMDEKLAGRVRVAVTLALNGLKKRPEAVEEIYDRPVEDPIDFGAIFSVVGSSQPNCEFEWNGRWYPIAAWVHIPPDDASDERAVVRLNANIRLSDLRHSLTYVVQPDLFVDESGRRRSMTVRAVLHALTLRPVQTEPREHNLRLANAERRSRETGKQVRIAGRVVSVSASSPWRNTLTPLALGTPERPRKAVVDAELEGEQDDFYGGMDGVRASQLPFVRVFSLDLKSYVYADVDDLREYEYDGGAMSRLHLPDGMRSLLTRVFDTPADKLFGDIIDGKHGGVVILASGTPGVGKTLTSEVYAEKSRRPLYVLELGELGTNVETVERNLQTIFARVAKWNAVLQFDECEVFLSRRGDDLQRSAIVGIFLRLLDYYEGILFLTSNRPEVIDPAVHSRVMLHLRYPPLDAAARRAVWAAVLERAGVELPDGDLERVAEASLNGRQIRNLVRLACVLHPDRRLTAADVLELTRYGYAEAV